MKQGIDVSLWNGAIDWSKVKTDFAMLRIATGKTLPDTEFEKNYLAAKQYNIPLGAYYYMYATDEATALKEAEQCYSFIKNKQFEYPIYLDIETDAQSQLSQKKLESIIKTFLDFLESKKLYVGIYSFESLLSKLSKNFRDRYTIWCANISSQPKINYDIWQYSWKGRNAGVGNGKADVDMNYCDKDFPSIIKKAQLNNFTQAEIITSKKITTYIDYIPKTITFKTDKKKNVITTYKKAASNTTVSNTKLSNHFQVKEFISKSGNKIYSNDVKIHNKLIQILEALFAYLNCSQIIVTSGYRTPAHDLLVGGNGEGQHTLGRAADIVCYDKDKKIISAKTVCCALEDMGGIYGIGYISPSATHVDTRDKSKQWWGDESKSGAPNIKKLGYSSFHDYFNI